MSRPKRTSRHDYTRQTYAIDRSMSVIDANYARLQATMGALSAYLQASDDKSSPFRLSTPLERIEVHYSSDDDDQVILAVSCEGAPTRKFVFHADDTDDTDDTDPMDLDEDGWRPPDGVGPSRDPDPG